MLAILLIDASLSDGQKLSYLHWARGIFTYFVRYYVVSSKITWFFGKEWAHFSSSFFWETIRIFLLKKQDLFKAVLIDFFDPD